MGCSKAPIKTLVQVIMEGKLACTTLAEMGLLMRYCRSWTLYCCGLSEFSSLRGSREGSILEKGMKPGILGTKCAQWGRFLLFTPQLKKDGKRKDSHIYFYLQNYIWFSLLKQRKGKESKTIRLRGYFLSQLFYH